MSSLPHIKHVATLSTYIKIHATTKFAFHFSVIRLDGRDCSELLST